MEVERRQSLETVCLFCISSICVVKIDSTDRATASVGYELPLKRNPIWCSSSEVKRAQRPIERREKKHKISGSMTTLNSPVYIVFDLLAVAVNRGISERGKNPLDEAK